MKVLQKEKTLIREIVDRLLNKLTSARFLVTLLFTFTYCKLMLWTLDMTAGGKISVETCLGILGGFSPLVILIVEWYFDKDGSSEITKKET